VRPSYIGRGSLASIRWKESSVYFVSFEAGQIFNDRTDVFRGNRGVIDSLIKANGSILQRLILTSHWYGLPHTLV
jgi:hypothetical protein